MPGLFHVCGTRPRMELPGFQMIVWRNREQAMKTPKVIVNVERQAERQLNLVLRAVRQQYKRFISGSASSTAAAQRKFIRNAEKTIDSAEDIIAEMKPRIAAVKRSLAGPTRKKKKVRRKTTRASATKKRAASKSRKKKL